MIYNIIGAVNRGVRANSGKIVGVIHESFLVDIKVDHEISELIVTRGNDLNERKQLLFDNSDCLVVMPGGFGTFDELCDYLCARTLNMKGLIGKRCVLVNIQQVRKAEEEQLLYDKLSNSLDIVNTVDECIEWLINNKRVVESQSQTSSKTVGSVDSTVVTQTVGSRTTNHNDSNAISTTTSTIFTFSNQSFLLGLFLGTAVTGVTFYRLFASKH